ncbi:hypothetical protein [Rhizobium sp. P44RR-XXIV]|uniref:hypothetical protein n=1 Tax=Rhizobium sp. P44RR-XXIV TaxID=1921145 RepID=UPI0010AADAEE|nr:hypothetical protein [Rhizobium sp. P44RR-XXIV]TIX90768.1 hypothetical protein BSK43_016085 [Rhizobium sp. P44RR-XXIV]
MTFDFGAVAGTVPAKDGAFKCRLPDPAAMLGYQLFPVTIHLAAAPNHNHATRKTGERPTLPLDNVVGALGAAA